MRVVDTLKTWARRIRSDALTLWFCARHPGTPWTAKLLALVLAAYAFSPIDLIPDFIPVLGLLDEAILLPLGILLCIRLVPSAVLQECRQRAADWLGAARPRPRSYVAAGIIVTLWALTLWAGWRFLSA